MAKKFTRGVTYQWKAKDLANAQEYLYDERFQKCLGSRGIGVPEQKRAIVKTRKMSHLRVFWAIQACTIPSRFYVLNNCS